MVSENIDLTGRVALVTGASRGIGAAVAYGLAKAGAHVVVVARTQGALEDLDDRIVAAGGSCSLVPLDLTKFAELEKLGPSLHERFGRLDMLVSCAGTLGTLTPAHHLEHKDLERVMRLNFTANVRLIRNLDPLLRASDAGRAVFLTSGMAQMCHAYYAAYAASKAALEAYVKTYAAELLQTNLKVNLLSPGMVETQMLKEAFPGGLEGQNVKQPEDVLPAVLDLVSPTLKAHGEIISL